MSGEQNIRRALSAYSPLRRGPHAMLRRMLDWLTPETPLSGPDAPVAQLERRVAELLGKPRARSSRRAPWPSRSRFASTPTAPAGGSSTAHQQNHLDLHEQRGYVVVHGMGYHPAGNRDLPLTLADLEGRPRAGVCPARRAAAAGDRRHPPHLGRARAVGRLGA